MDDRLLGSRNHHVGADISRCPLRSSKWIEEEESVLQGCVIDCISSSPTVYRIR